MRVSTMALTPSPAVLAARVFNCLGDPARLSIIMKLEVCEANVTELCGMVSKRQQAVSHHLTILKLRGFVRCERRGKTNVYHLTETGRELAVLAQTRFAVGA